MFSKLQEDALQIDLRARALEKISKSEFACIYNYHQGRNAEEVLERKVKEINEIDENEIWNFIKNCDQFHDLVGDCVETSSEIKTELHNIQMEMNLVIEKPALIDETLDTECAAAAGNGNGNTSSASEDKENFNGDNSAAGDESSDDLNIVIARSIVGNDDIPPDTPAIKRRPTEQSDLKRTLFARQRF